MLVTIRIILRFCFFCNFTQYHLFLFIFLFFILFLFIFLLFFFFFFLIFIFFFFLLFIYLSHLFVISNIFNICLFYTNISSIFRRFRFVCCFNRNCTTGFNTHFIHFFTVHNNCVE